MRTNEDVWAAREKTRDRLVKAQAEAALIPELERQLAGFDSYLAFEEAHKNGSPPPVSPQEEITVRTDWEALTRPQAIMAVLHSTKRGLSPADIEARLHEVGRLKDNTHNISTTLTTLKKRSLVRSRGRGRWLPVRSPSQRAAE